MEKGRFESLLEELDKTLRQYNLIEYNKLQLPLSTQKIDKYLETLEVSDVNLKALYQWKNGEEEESNCQMTDVGGFQSLESVTKDLANSKQYDSSFIEIFSDNRENSLLFNRKSGPHYGKLYFYSIGLYMEYPISYYDSLGSMVITIIKSYRNKAFVYDTDNKWLDIDFKKFKTIAKTINTNSVFWKKHNPLKPKEWYEI